MHWAAQWKAGLVFENSLFSRLELSPRSRRIESARANQGKLKERGASSGKHGAQAADEAARTELSPNQAEVPDDISLGDYASHSASLSTDSRLQNQGRRVARGPSRPSSSESALHEQT